MKNIIKIAAVALVGLSFTSCDDFLNDNRFPLSSQAVNSAFWSNKVNVENQINYFYQDYSGYGNGSGGGTFYWKWLSDDQVGRKEFENWTFTNVPASSTSWSAPYIEVRRANLVIEGVAGSTLSEVEKTNYTALARLHRARSYADLVHRYGDVPLVTTPLDPDDDAELFGPRTPRNEVADFILEDFNFAVANIATKSSKTELSADLAQAQKLEFCLYEGSYARYHQKDETRAKKFFEEAVKAGEAIADRYPIGSDYSANYRSARTALGDYAALSANSEMIFIKEYNNGVFMNSITDYSNASDGVAGITKDAFDNYLFTDGRPAASTTLNNTDLGVPTESGIDISNLLAVRDKRLSMVTYPAIAAQGMSWAASNTVGFWSGTGYGVSKFNNFALPVSIVNEINKGYLCAALYWGARLYIGIAEAKAELGTLTDADVAKYIKPLWDRAGIDTSKLNVAWLANMNDPANNMGVSSLIWEVRRCRRCELIMDDNIRYWDLVRWHQLELLDSNKHPNILLGANVSNAPEKFKPAIPQSNGYVNGSFGQQRTFNEKYYLYPVPSGQIALNIKLTQNPGW